MVQVQPLTRRDALVTYRWLRIGMVGAVGFLASAVAIEIVRDDFTVQASLSAYWYTPARPVLVGSLIAIGIALLVIRGTSGWEDTFLNFAGLAAPVVALVPTTLPGDTTLTDPDVLALVANNVGALLLVGALGIALAVRLLPGGELPRAGSAAHVGLLGTGVIYLTTAIAFLAFRPALLRWGHTIAASLLIVCMAVAVAITSTAPDLRDERLRPTYQLLALVMLGTLVGTVVARITGVAWRHLVLVVEIVEITAFALFWALQTWERWGEAEPRHAPGWAR